MHNSSISALFWEWSSTNLMGIILRGSCGGGYWGVVVVVIGSLVRGSGMKLLATIITHRYAVFKCGS